MKQQILLVDAYNMIGHWPELERLKKADQLEAARDRLLHILSAYHKQVNARIIVVFDAMYVPGLGQSYERYGLEDAARTSRAKKAGLTGHPHYFSFPVRGLAYIHSEDIFGVTAIQNMTMEEKLKYVHKNQETYNKEIGSDKLFYEF